MFAAEEDRESWNKSYRQTFLSEGYKTYLQAAAQEVRAVRNGPGGVLLLNLSPPWCAAAALYDGGLREGKVPGQKLGGPWAAVVETVPRAAVAAGHAVLPGSTHQALRWTARCRNNGEAYKLFDNSVFELPMVDVWEKPSGLALCPLHIL